MSVSLVGELSVDERHIVLIADGPNEALANMARYLHTLTPAFEKSKPAGALLVPTSWGAVVQLSHTFGAAWKAGPRLTRWVGEELARRTVDPGPMAYTPPPGWVPRDYQVEGALMIATTGRALLFDEQGTGKTITTILGLVERARTSPNTFPVVCVVPASTVDPWVEAWRAWAPHLKAVAWRGVPTKRKALLGTADVYVTSYHTAVMDASNPDGPLVKLKAPSIVADEVHLIKSPIAVRSIAVRHMAKRARVFVGLSGTPITHTPDDLWPTLEALAPHVFPAHERYTNRYCAKDDAQYGSPSIFGLNAAHEAEFRLVLRGQHRRVAKADVLKSLPPKIYSTRVVALPPEYRRMYDDMEQQMLAMMADGTELSVMSVLAQLTRLAQLAAAPADVVVTYEQHPETGEDIPHTTVTLKAPSWKVNALIEVLDERPGSPVVAFTPSKQLTMLAAAAAKASGREVGLVVGGQLMTDRTDTVNAFQQGKLDLLCVTTGAGGVGLTLTAAGTVVFLQRPWSIVEALQAEDRCHRIGSEIHDVVEIIDIVAERTIDTRVREVLRGKASMLAELLEDPRIVNQLLGGKA